MTNWIVAHFGSEKLACSSRAYQKMIPRPSLREKGGYGSGVIAKRLCEVLLILFTEVRVLLMPQFILSWLNHFTIFLTLLYIPSYSVPLPEAGNDSF